MIVREGVTKPKRGKLLLKSRLKVVNDFHPTKGNITFNMDMR